MIQNRKNGYQFSEAVAIKSGLTKEEYQKIKQSVMDNTLLKKKFILLEEPKVQAKVEKPVISNAKVNAKAKEK